MEPRILTANGIDNTNIDGARNYNFNSGNRSGIVKGAFNQGNFFSSALNIITLDTCELRLSGHRIIIEEPYSISLTQYDAPAAAIRYSMIAEISVNNVSNPTFRIFLQSSSTELIKNNLFQTGTGEGIYQLEIGRFTLKPDLTIEDVIRTADIITGGTDDENTYITIGDVTTTITEAGTDAEVDIENVTEDGITKTNFYFSLPSGDSGVKSVNGQTGIVVLDADDIRDTSTINKFVSATEKAKIANSVQKTGNEDIYGLKTFDTRPKVGIEQELPSAYSKLDYIQSTNGQYIDVGYYPNNIKKSQIKFSFDNVSGEQWLLGMQASVGGALSHTGGQAFVMLQSGVIKYKIWGYDTSTSAFVTEHTYSTNLTAEVDKIYEVETMMISQSQYIKIDGNTLATSNVYRDENAARNAYLFKGSGIGYPAYIKLYECKLYDYSDNLIRDYVPCKRITDDAIGLYDFVSETFYPSASTSFVAGPETIPSDNDRVMLKGDIDKITTLDGTETEINGLVLKGERVKFPRGQIIQVDTIPSASSSNNGQIVQYIGITTLTYTNGYFYKSNGTSWDNINVQPSSGGGSGITNYEVINRVNSIPTATATSPDFIQVSGVNYAKKRIIDLSNTTWLINSTPSMPTGDPIYSINFTSNNSNLNLFYFITTGGYRDLIYSDTELTNGVHAYSEQDDEWSDGTVYQTITITDGNDANNEALYNWLIENATLQSGTVVGYEYVPPQITNKYSTEETVVGEWIDGKKLYRKVIVAGSGLINGIKEIAHNITNMDKCINATFTLITGNQFFFHWGNYIKDFEVNQNHINIAATHTGFNDIYFILEYTKTTD